MCKVVGLRLKDQYPITVIGIPPSHPWFDRSWIDVEDNGVDGISTSFPGEPGEELWWFEIRGDRPARERLERAAEQLYEVGLREPVIPEEDE